MGVMFLATSCAEEHLDYTPAVLNKIDTVLVKQDLVYEHMLQYQVKPKAEFLLAKVEISQQSRTVGLNGETTEIDITLNPTASVEIKMEKDSILVDELTAPTLVDGGSISEVETNTDEFSKSTTCSFTGVDKLSDSQVVNLNANWVYRFLQSKSEKVDFAHIEITDVYLASVSTEVVDDLTMKVLLNYDVEYKTVGTTAGELSEKITVSPYYFQKVKEVIDQAGEPYYVCEPTYTYNENSISCKFVVNKITPHTLEADEVEKIAQRTLKVASIGRPGDETLYVFTPEMSSNNYTTSEANITTGEKNGFSWTESASEHLFRAEWNSDGLEVGHSDKIMLYEVDVKYKNEHFECNFDFTTELKVVKNEVIVESGVTTEGYIGTRVLTIEGYFNGEKFAEFTGKTTLLQHE